MTAMAGPDTGPDVGVELIDLPTYLEAGEPPEARGLARDQVRLMVSSRTTNRLTHARFSALPSLLEAGDVLVVNTSGTMNAALHGTRSGGQAIELHLSTRLPGGMWTVEVRAPDGGSTRPLFDLQPETLDLAGGGRAILHAAYDCGCGRTGSGEPARLWFASLRLPLKIPDYLARYGFPIRYSYVRQEWPISYYQTAYVTETGSAEMPSAGRAFTAELLTALTAQGIQIAPLLLHTGVASLESREPPYEEYYRVPPATARLINSARSSGRRVIAVGTTVVRALETVVDDVGVVHPGEGWTCVVVTPERGIRSVDGLLTGLHEPASSHLMMLAALASRDHLKKAYAEAVREGYLWHEFGDLHLILP